MLCGCILVTMLFPVLLLLFCSSGFTAGQVLIVEGIDAGLGVDLNLCMYYVKALNIDAFFLLPIFPLYYFDMMKQYSNCPSIYFLADYH